MSCGLNRNWSSPSIGEVSLKCMGKKHAINSSALAMELLQSCTKPSIWMCNCCDQAVLWTVLSVCLPICHTFFTIFLSLYHHEIFRSNYHWQKWCPCKSSWSEVKGQGHRSKQILLQFRHFLTITPVWIHRWLQNNKQSLMWHRSDALLSFKVIHATSRSRWPQICQFDPDFSVSGQ